MTKTKPHSPSKPLDVRLAATRLLQWLEQGATPNVADVELVAKSYISLSRPQAGTLTEDEQQAVAGAITCVELFQSATVEMVEDLLAIVNRLTTPPATEEDA